MAVVKIQTRVRPTCSCGHAFAQYTTMSAVLKQLAQHITILGMVNAETHVVGYTFDFTAVKKPATITFEELERTATLLGLKRRK